MAEQNNNLEEQLNEQIKMQQSIEIIENAAKKIMTREAISRYGNIKLAFPQKAIKAIMIIAQMSEAGMSEKIDDEKFKAVLRQIKP